MLQEQVTTATGKDYGSFATLNGVPLAMDFITNSDITAGARRVYGQSCLTESNTLYEVGGLLKTGTTPPSMSAVLTWHMTSFSMVSAYEEVQAF